MGELASAMLHRCRKIVAIAISAMTSEGLAHFLARVACSTSGAVAFKLGVSRSRWDPLWPHEVDARSVWHRSPDSLRVQLNPLYRRLQLRTAVAVP